VPHVGELLRRPPAVPLGLRGHEGGDLGPGVGVAELLAPESDELLDEVFAPEGRAAGLRVGRLALALALAVLVALALLARAVVRADAFAIGLERGTTKSEKMWRRRLENVQDGR